MLVYPTLDFADQFHRELSIGESGVPALKRYIANQKEHHRKVTFQEELIEFLKKYGVAYDERYIWA